MFGRETIQQVGLLCIICGIPNRRVASVFGFHLGVLYRYLHSIGSSGTSQPDATIVSGAPTYSSSSPYQSLPTWSYTF
jgi:hypothetical protein